MRKSICFICGACLLLTLAACGDNRMNTHDPTQTDTMTRDNTTMYPDNTYDQHRNTGTDTGRYHNNSGDTERAGNRTP
jgi:hypothetical protein